MVCAGCICLFLLLRLCRRRSGQQSLCAESWWAAGFLAILRCNRVALWKLLRLWNLLFLLFMSYKADNKGNTATILCDFVYLIPVHAHCTQRSSIWKQGFLFILMLKDLMITGLKVNHTVVQSGRLVKKRKNAHLAFLCLANSHKSFWYHFLTAIN